MANAYAPRPKAYQPRPRQAIKPEVQGPFIGMRDNSEPTASHPQLAYLAQNVYPISAQRGGAMVGRPGFAQFGAQLAAGVGQLIYQFTRLDGTEATIAIVAGEIYKADWSDHTWDKVVTTANLTTASAALSNTARCYAVTFNDKMVISDGTNLAIAWDGTTGAGGITELTNAPVFYGPLTVYYGKLFGIKNTSRKTIVWSEENQPNTGYEAGGYNNAWDLLQTDQEPLYAVQGTNEALYYFRARSIGAIGGAVETDFQTTGTREGVSETVGTTAPASIIYRDRRIFFQDADGKPHVIAPGLGVLPIWEDFSETLSFMDAANRGDTIGWVDEPTQMLGFAMTETGQTIPSASLMFNPVGNVPQAVAVWRGYTVSAIGTVKNTSGRLLTMHLSSDGYAYDHGTPDGTYWTDDLAGGEVAISHVVESGAAYYDPDWEKQFDRLDVTFRANDTSGVSVSYVTPRGGSAVLGLPTISGSLSRWDDAVWDTDVWSFEALETKECVGLAAVGRWIRWRVEHSALGEKFGLLLGKVRALILHNEPGAP